MSFTGDDGCQFFLVYSPILSLLILNSNKKVNNWISIRTWSEKIKASDATLESIMSNLANGRVILKFNNFVLVEKNSSSFYSNFLLYSYIVYESKNWWCNPTNNLPLKIFLFSTVKLVRNTIKCKFISNSRVIAFDGEGSWSFGNDLVKML